ncbi:MAG: hypothetical protein ABSH16_02595 [Sedimentisphaerales bacterium]
MKKILVLVLVLASPVFAEPPSGRNPIGSVIEGTKVRPYYLVNAASANDVSLDEKTRFWEHIRPPSGSFAVIDETCNRLEFAFYVDGNTADKQYIDPNQVEFNYRIFAARKYSSAVIVCAGSAKCGELELSGTPTDTHNGNLFNGGNLSEDESHKWVSGLSNSAVKWPTAVVFTDAKQADNGIARITLETNGYALWWCEITSIKGNPGRITCVASGW